MNNLNLSHDRYLWNVESLLLELLPLYKKFLLYSSAKQGQIRSVSLDPEDRDYDIIQPLLYIDRPVALDYDKRNGYIYYSDASNSMIGRRKIDGSEPNEPFIKSEYMLMFSCLTIF